MIVPDWRVQKPGVLKNLSCEMLGLLGDSRLVENCAAWEGFVSRSGARAARLGGG